MTLPDLTHVEVRNRKAARTAKKTRPQCKIQVPVARQRCENCPHQFISNAAPDRGAGAGARIWCGATVNTEDLEALFPWIEYAFAECS